MHKQLITIDGASATGKGTVAKMLAEKLGWLCFDTGAMYRAFGYLSRALELDIKDSLAVKEALDSFNFKVKEIGGEKHYFLQDKDITDEIRTLEISSWASKTSQLREVREKMVAIQREIGELQPTVFEGRDMGSHVFPKAPLKVFLVANAEIRAKRRLADLKAQNKEVSFEIVLQELEKRDQQDSEREISPLVKVQGALEIDTSHKSPQQIVDEILAVWLKNH
ncbi:MAG: (d)CMP kinase [Chlamydiales bacterium]|nr:(d)CMP kinase [Chlamydiales bacterium]